jgi:hypothetical protein
VITISDDEDNANNHVSASFTPAGGKSSSRNQRCFIGAMCDV